MVQFNKVLGEFNCTSNKLKSLKGCKTEIELHFNCYNNEITQLKYLPLKIKGDINCSRNKIKSLKGIYKIIYGSFWCSDNELESSNVYTYLLNEKLSKKINQNIKTNQVLKNKTKI